MLDPAEDRSAAILPLPADAVAQIRSSTAITSLSGVVFGLLENSLDAQATRIEVSVDFRRGGCAIEDNGLGIQPLDFREGGGLGRMYHTSKQNFEAQLELHGGQGTFVASVAALSQLTITSRHFGHHSHNTLIIHRAKPISRLIPAPAQHEVRNSAFHGTRVTVRDLFGNMPVRVKQRAMIADDSAEVEKQWQDLRKGIVALLLPLQNRLAVKVFDVENVARNLSISTVANLAPNALNERNLNSLNQRTTMASVDTSVVLDVLAQAGFISAGSKDSWIPASASTSSVTVKGVISLEPAPSRTAQFISIGIVPCLDENRHNELYDAINQLFIQSTFGKIEDGLELDSVELERRKCDRRYKTDGPTKRQLRGGRKGVDRWPKFYFRIELKNDGESQPISKLSDMRLRTITHVLEVLAIQWLEANAFRPRNPRQNHKTTTTRAGQAPGSDSLMSAVPYSFITKGGCTSEAGDYGSRRRTVDQAGLSGEQRGGMRNIGQNPGTAISTAKLPFADWSRIKSAKPIMYDNIWGCRKQLAREQLGHQSDHSLEERPASASRTTPRFQVEKAPAGQFGSENLHPDDASQGLNLTQTRAHGSKSSIKQGRSAHTDDVIEWIDPVANERYQVNARTGIVMPSTSRRPVSADSSLMRPAAAADAQTSSFGKPLRLERRIKAPVDGTAPPASWLDGVLRTWRNPIFVNQTEKAIPVAGFEGPGNEVRERGHLTRQVQIADSFLQSGRIDTSRLSKAALAYAQVISQVDQKFILMKMPSAVGSTSEMDFDRQLLVLVDQHAASERCILEDLLGELCTPAPDMPVLKSNLGHTSPITTTQLDETLRFQIPTSQEETLFKLHAAHFARWGILYEVLGARLRVLSLPPVIHERCTSTPALLIELLRNELWILNQTSSRSRATTPANTPWLQQIGSCPGGILQLLNSRACRSAVMFNDVLGLDECEALVQRLAGCVFPFMCAHGRNSVVPLVYLGGRDGEDDRTLVGGGGEEREEQGFASAWNKWREKKR